MTTPLPPQINPVAALAGKPARKLSDAPMAAHWLANPAQWRKPLDRREQAMQDLLHFLHGFSPPQLVARWKAEAAGLPPSQALSLFASHLDDPLPPPRSSACPDP